MSKAEAAQSPRPPKKLDGLDVGWLNSNGVFQCPACHKKNHVSALFEAGGAHTRQYAQRGAKRYFKCHVCEKNFVIVDMKGLLAEQSAERQERGKQLATAVADWEKRLDLARKASSQITVAITAAEAGLAAAQKELAAFPHSPPA